MTADELVDLWTTRDGHYARRRSDLSDEVVEGIRAWRAREAHDIEAWGLAREALRWIPPLRRGK